MAEALRVSPDGRRSADGFFPPQNKSERTRNIYIYRNRYENMCIGFLHIDDFFHRKMRDEVSIEEKTQ